MTGPEGVKSLSGQALVDDFNRKEMLTLNDAKGLDVSLEKTPMNFQELSEESLENAKEIVGKVFALEGDAAPKDLESTIHPSEESRKEDVIYKMKKYWVAKSEQDEVIAVTGIYELAGDKEGNVWLGWFALKPGIKGTGLGSQLMDFSLEEAKKVGGKNMYIISSDHPDMAGNGKFYQKNDCPIVAVLGKSGDHVGNGAAGLSRPLLAATHEHYRSFIDEGVNMFIRRREIQ